MLRSRSRLLWPVARLPLEVAYATTIKANRDRTEQFVLAQFTKGQHRDKDAAKFLANVVPVVLASRRQVSAITDSYLAQKLSKQLGRTVRPRGPINTDVLRGIDPAEVYQRPYQATWTALSEGKAYDMAVRAGTERLTDIVLTDLQMAKTYTAQDVLSNTKSVTGFSRVISGVNTCALCAIASTQRYSREDLLPIHPGCSCDVEPLTADSPWDQEAMDQRLADTHAAVEDRLGISDAGGRNVGLGTGRDYTKLIVTNNHGEIGPVLSVRGQHFTGPSQLTKAAPGAYSPGALTPERLSSVNAQLASYEKTIANGGGTDWLREQIPRLTAERDSLTN